jgi:phosphohistidine phosphatase
MARRWIDRALVPDRMLTSPAVRAHRTAVLFAGEFGFAPASIRLDDRLYLARPGELLEVIHDTPAGTRHLMVFGHNPGISALARMLCADLPLVELPTAAVCTVKSTARSWSRFESATIALVACERP